MAAIFKSLLDLIGKTPLLELSRIDPQACARNQILAKLESFNPGGSVKDRAALYMVLDAERKGKLLPSGTLIEPTSGNTGIGLSLVAAIRGYKLILTMPESMSVERRRLLAARGAKIVLTPASQGMQGAVDKALELQASTPNSLILGQFDNEANIKAHIETTAQEILTDTDRKLDIFVAGVGTGGTFSGVASVLKKELPHIKVVALEPSASPLLSAGKAGPHKLQGIGANFIPANFRNEYVDEIITVSNEDAFACAAKLATTEGVLAGISSGAALHAALELARRSENEGKRIVVMLPDTGERYLSTGVFDNSGE